ncbi:CHASE domain-containing protein [Sphingomonas sp. J315]|uniref:CHASE domain-containing protein n=1 Tax=Sphingomonas sp. J315 TaxID=2898433 RepID=UPI0021AE279C|nr:CHASE domain-containing protein [Sphingomonas sp. J315]UUX99128.1 CHASE domain-containing protein [Sphingomonas sp. J315]
MEPATDAPAPERAVTGAHAPGETHLSVQTRLRLGLILILLFIASGWVAKQLAVPPANVTMLWLPSGVAVGAVLLYGRWLLPAVFIGSISLNLILGVSMGSTVLRAGELAVWTATGAMLQALIADTLLRRRFGDHVELTRARDVAAAIALAVVIPALVSASIGHLALMALRDFPVEGVPGSMATWALGDILGILSVAPFAMIGERRRFRAEWRGAPIRGLFGYIALGCGLGLALTMFAWINARARVHDSSQASFTVLATESEQALRARLNRTAQSLDAASALFTAGERVTWAEWVAYSRVIDIENSYPGVRDIGFIRRVRRADVAAFLSETRRNGLPIERITRAPPTGDHYVVTYIHPLEKNRGVLGMDITFDPKRRNAADQARDSGAAVATRPLDFVQYRGPGYGFTIMRPVYATQIPPRDVAERRRTLFGWVYHPFSAQRFFKGLTQGQGHDFELRIQAQDEANRWTTVFDTLSGQTKAAHDPEHVISRQFDVAGRVWLLEWRSTAAFEARMGSVEPLLVLLTGLTINLALAAVLAVVARREAVVTREVERATSELSEANRLLLMTEATTHVGHWRYDIAEGTLFWSEEVYRIHGRDRDRPITRDEGLDYLHPEDKGRTWEALLHSVRDQAPFALKVRIRRGDDGELRHLSYVGRAEPGPDGKPGALFGVIQDVTNETRVRAQLLKARDAAQREAQIRGSFLANLSHEIRTPMNGVIGSAELLLESRLAAEQRNYAQIIVESGTNMMSLLNDVLDLSKIEAGHMDLADEPVALEELANSAIRMLMPSVRRRQVWLEVQIDPALPPIVRGDKLRLRQVLLNLLGNAVKFTQQGFVRLEVSRIGDLMRFAVVDSGPGIPPDRLSDIFKSFVQLDPVGRTGGTGLGLTISSSLVRLMGGALKVNSRVGEGSSFHFTLPCIPASLEDDEPKAAADDAAPVRKIPDVAATRVLLAEDNEINQALIRATAARLGLDLDVASNGSDAVVRAEAAAQAGAPYDLILMDIQMPVLDGIGATQRLRSMGFSAQTLPIVALSANVYQNDIDACFAAGMQAHLAKPVRREALEQAIATWARQRPGNGLRPALPTTPPPPNRCPLRWSNAMSSGGRRWPRRCARLTCRPQTTRGRSPRCSRISTSWPGPPGISATPQLETWRARPSAQ